MGFTTNEWAVLLLVLLLGWLLGLASRSGGGKWRRRYEEERAAHAAARDGNDARLAAADARISALERDRDQSRAPVAPPVADTRISTISGDRDTRVSTISGDRDGGRGHAVPRAATVTPIAAATAAGASGLAHPRQHDAGDGHAARGDDLSRINGIGREGEVQLNQAGVHRYSDLASLTARDQAALEERLGIAPGRIARERWAEQAERLATGDTERRPFG